MPYGGFDVFVDEDHSKLPTLYWLHKLHKQPYKSRFIANSSSCTTTELSILLTSGLNAINLFDLNLYVPSTIFQLYRTGLRGLNQ